MASPKERFSVGGAEKDVGFSNCDVDYLGSVGET